MYLLRNCSLKRELIDLFGLFFDFEIGRLLNEVVFVYSIVGLFKRGNFFGCFFFVKDK